MELTRRQVMEAMAVCGLITASGCVGSGQEGTATTVAPRSADAVGPTAHRLATRLSFGPTPDLMELAATGSDAYLADQLDSGAADSPGMTALFSAIEARGENLWASAEQGGQETPAIRRRASLETTALRTVAGAAWSTRQLHALLCDFWADHLHVSISEQPEMFYVPAYDSEVIRAHALGSFSEMLVASARSAAMLTYLDQSSSRADGDNVPNENYARELMELQTVGVDGGYDETDVLEAAHILSGYSLRRRSDEFVYRARWHDLGPLALGGDVLGYVPSGATGAAAVRDGEDFLAHLARLPQTARHVCHRLAIRLIGDSVAADSAVVAAAAEAFSSEDTSIAAAVRALVSSEEFASADAVARRPLDLVAATMRMGCAPATGEQLDSLVRPVGGTLRLLGHLPWTWPAPNGFPLPGRAWINAGSMVSRLNAGLAAAAGYGVLDPLQGTTTGEDTSPDQVATALLGRKPSAELTRALSGVAAGATASDPLDGLTTRALVFSSPDFQER